MPQEALEGTSERLSPLLQVKYASLISVALEQLLALMVTSRKIHSVTPAHLALAVTDTAGQLWELFFHSEE